MWICNNQCQFGTGVFYEVGSLKMTSGKAQEVDWSCTTSNQSGEVWSNT